MAATKLTSDERELYNEYVHRMKTGGIQPRTAIQWVRHYRKGQKAKPALKPRPPTPEKPVEPPTLDKPRRKPGKGKVMCPNCNRVQPDGGKRTTCACCGCQPLPSYAYVESSAFHPDHVS